eukprot:6743709-Prymnesium_polylepis.1
MGREHGAFREKACGGPASAGMVPTASIACGGHHRPCAPDLSPEARELFLLDWWFASSSSAANSFGDVASEKVPPDAERAAAATPPATT